VALERTELLVQAVQASVVMVPLAQGHRLVAQPILVQVVVELVSVLLRGWLVLAVRA
jgi:hypothetical protein